MNVVERFLDNNDWMTLVLLGIAFLLVAANLLNARRLRYLLSLPYTDLYILNFGPPIWHAFNVLLFIFSNLIISIFIYLLVAQFYSDKILFTSYLFLKINSFILGYWFIKYSLGKFIAYLFEIEKWQKKIIFIKISYFFSSSIYLFIFLIFAIYFFKNSTAYLYTTIGFYSILLLIRYFHFLRILKKEIASNLFYFILYLCALEIAPLCIAIKISV